MLTVSSYDIKELYITYVYIYVQCKWPNIIARMVHVTSRHKLENGRNVSNWAIIEVTISRPETIEVTSIIARLLTSRLFADLSLRAIVLREWYLEWGMRRAEAIYWRRRLKSQGGRKSLRSAMMWCDYVSCDYVNHYCRRSQLHVRWFYNVSTTLVPTISCCQS